MENEINPHLGFIMWVKRKSKVKSLNNPHTARQTLSVCAHQIKQQELKFVCTNLCWRQLNYVLRSQSTSTFLPQHTEAKADDFGQESVPPFYSYTSATPNDSFTSFEVHGCVCERESVFVCECSHICYPDNIWHPGYTSYTHTNMEIWTPSHTIITSCTSALWSCPRQASVQSTFNETDPSHNQWRTHTLTQII